MVKNKKDIDSTEKDELSNSEIADKQKEVIEDNEVFQEEFTLQAEEVLRDIKENQVIEELSVVPLLPDLIEVPSGEISLIGEAGKYKLTLGNINLSLTEDGLEKLNKAVRSYLNY